MMISFITIKSSLVPLIEGLCAQIKELRFEIIRRACLSIFIYGETNKQFRAYGQTVYGKTSKIKGKSLSWNQMHITQKLFVGFLPNLHQQTRRVLVHLFVYEVIVVQTHNYVP